MPRVPPAGAAGGTDVKPGRALFVVAVVVLTSPLLFGVAAATQEPAAPAPAAPQDAGGPGARGAGAPCGEGRGREGNRGREGGRGREGRAGGEGRGREGREGRGGRE